MGKKALGIKTSDLMSEVLSNAVLLNTKEKVKLFEVEGTNLFNQRTYLMDRDYCETDITHLQLLPYVLIGKKQDGLTRYFTYRRGNKGNESRLHDLFSIGVGGHVEEAPTAAIKLDSVLINCAKREIKEEIGIIVPYSVLQAALANALIIHDCSNEVGRVHLGIAMVVFVSNINIGATEEGVISDHGWYTVPELRAKNLESWSSILIGREK